MRLIRLTLVSIKRQLKNPFLLIMTLILPIVVLVAINMGSFSSNSGAVGIIDNSKSSYSREIIEKLEEEYDVNILEKNIEDNFNMLRDGKTGVIYVFDENFDKSLNERETPKVKCYRTQASVGSLMAENIIADYINGILQEEVSEGLSKNTIITTIEEDDINSKEDYLMTVMMICYFMIIGGSGITEDIIRLKSQKVLRRAVSTANTDREILGSLFIATFIIQGVISSIALSAVSIILKIDNYNPLQGTLIIFLMSLFSTAIILATTRWIKNSVLASLFVVIFGLAAFGIGMFGAEMQMFENIPTIITRLSVLSPFTWLLKIINTGEVMVPIIVVFLMSGVFFTAGSFRLREFVKE